VQGLGALEVLGRVVRVQAELPDHLGREERHAPNSLRLQVRDRRRHEVPHAVAAVDTTDYNKKLD
jgi:hypothetical protein